MRIILIPLPVHQQPLGAFITQRSFVVPGFAGLDDLHLPPSTVLDVFYEALQGGEQVFLIALEPEEREERKMEAEYPRQPEQEHESHRRAVDVAFLRRIEEDSRKAEEVHRRALQEDFARQQAERTRKVLGAHRRAEQERQRQAQAEREAMERARREKERLERERREQERFERERRKQEHLERELREQERFERERREQERLEQGRREREAAQPDFATLLCLYEEKWAKVRSNSDGAEPLKFNDIPWPWFGDVRYFEDITDKRVLAFMGHPLRKHMQGPSGGLAKTLRFEMLYWHPDKFDGRVLGRVIDDHREAVKKAAGLVAVF